ncbi:MAG TPA: competence/damage-inducible protein A [Gaiellaceae bacterium]|nr:competence/damage-inducible protein A [Gaiellaceae bacterium]
MHAAILTIGNELVSGDVPDSNASWLARRLESLGVRVVLTAAVPDELDRIATFVRRESPLVDHLVVTGGLGGTPDDITREAIAAAFGVGQTVVPELEAELRARFPHDPDYFGRWAALPDGATPLGGTSGAPGFRIANVWVLPGLPDEMRLMFDHYADELRGPAPIDSWRRHLIGTSERDIVRALVEATERWPTVLVGSYPIFTPEGPEVDVVLKSADSAALQEAAAFLAATLDSCPGSSRSPTSQT